VVAVAVAAVKKGLLCVDRWFVPNRLLGSIIIIIIIIWQIYLKTLIESKYSFIAESYKLPNR